MPSSDTRTVSYGSCECCGGDCCLTDLLAADGACFTMAPAVNDFDPTAGDPFRFQTYYQPASGNPYLLLGTQFVLILSGTTTLHGKPTCYYLELFGEVSCDGSGFKVRLWAPEFIATISNDTGRVIFGLAQPCSTHGATFDDTPTITFDCTEDTWSTGQTLSFDIDWRDERSNNDYTSTMAFTVYIGAPASGVCPTFTGAVDPPAEDVGPFDCTSAGGGNFGLFFVHLNDGAVTEAEIFQWGNAGTPCDYDFDTDPPDPWDNGGSPGSPGVDVSCTDAPMGRSIPATFGTNTGDCNCADDVEFSFYWFYDGSGPGNGFYYTFPISVCGHVVYLILTCFDGDWFIGGWVDGVGTGLMAWDVSPGNDPDNPNHFELHWDLFGDLCTGRIFIVAG